MVGTRRDPSCSLWSSGSSRGPSEVTTVQSGGAIWAWSLCSGQPPPEGAGGQRGGTWV